MKRTLFPLATLCYWTFLNCGVGFSLQSDSPIFPTTATQTSAPASSLDKARALLDSGKPDEALGELDSLGRLHPKMKGIDHLVGLAYYRKADFAKAQSAFQNAIKEDAQDREAIQLAGLSLYQLGRPAEAIAYLKQVQSWIGSANVDANYVLGLCFVQTQNYDEARRSFATMYGVAPDSAPAYLFMARMLLRQGYDPIAERHALKAAELDPKLPLVHYLLGEFYLYKANLDKAIEEFTIEQRLNPGYAGTYDRLGDCYTRMGKYDDAERALQRAILLDATATGPFILMGKALVKKKDFDSAVTYLKKALRMDPSNYIPHHLLGEAYRGLGRSADAEIEFKRSEELQARASSQQQ
jgi:tetratricopeptide (TPR) repeat protein